MSNIEEFEKPFFKNNTENLRAIDFQHYNLSHFNQNMKYTRLVRCTTKYELHSFNIPNGEKYFNIGGKEITYNRLTNKFEYVEDDKYKLIPLETYNNMIKQVNLLADKCDDQKNFIKKYIDLNTTERDELEELRTLKKLLDNDDTTIKQTLQRVEKILK